MPLYLCKLKRATMNFARKFKKYFGAFFEAKRASFSMRPVIRNGGSCFPKRDGHECEMNTIEIK